MSELRQYLTIETETVTFELGNEQVFACFHNHDTVEIFACKVEVDMDTYEQDYTFHGVYFLDENDCIVACSRSRDWEICGTDLQDIINEWAKEFEGVIE